MGMYHLELRQFPHNHVRFNLSEREVEGIALAWVQSRVIDIGERKWVPQQAKLTILRGPQLSVGQLTMGRGWTTAQREGEDVTEEILAEARDRVAAVSPPGATSAQPAAVSAGVPGTAPADGGATADPLALAVQLASLLGDDPAILLSAWRAIAAEQSGLSPSESLALAERRVATGAGDQP